MGVSVVEQEIAPPTTRSKNMPVDDDDEFGAAAAKPKSVKSVCIITEYLEQGSLADLLYGPHKLPAESWSYELALVCALQAARGMLYLHSHSPPICHRDLKSSNLVVDDHWVVKVTDFGMSRMVPEKLQDKEMGICADENDVSEGSDGRVSFEGSRPSIDNSTVDPRMSFNPMMTSNLGTTAWCAPELLTSSNKTRYSVKVDVYSFGLVLWELWERKRPYDDLYSRFDIIDAIRGGRRPPISQSCPPALKSLIQRCWHAQPARRPTFSYIVRYLKDELARIKRQRLASSSSSGASLRFSSSGGYTPPTNPATAPPQDVLNALHRDVTLSSDGERMSSGWRRFLSSSEDNDNPQSGGQSWLTRGRQNSNGGTGMSPQPNNSAISNGSKGSWRDRYVMRFSGWQASNPDTGLPPSVSGTAERKPSSNPMPIPPVPARHQANADAPGSSPSGHGAFSSVKNIVRRSESPSESSHQSARSLERDKEKERELAYSSSRHLSGGVSLQEMDQLSVSERNTVAESQNNTGAFDESFGESGRQRMRSTSC